ncbi:hypothetical protein ILUMI_01736 [Ignelater luminosus]|uniref:Uncharacterized protein n=1 Tax=Ignelater luminosus TaxID=2038154 RepID=A0A8K0DQ43_IGNLU|nr:hypothetical protein ILUMI_01736 [Ignelater luminosus]
MIFKSLQSSRTKKSIKAAGKYQEANQIDHVVVSKRWATAIQDVCTYRGINCDLDHFLMVAFTRQRIRNVQKQKGCKSKKWNIDKLRSNQNLIRYQEIIERKLSRNEASNDVELEWGHMKDTILKAADGMEEVKKRRNSEWFNEECRQVIKGKDEARNKCLQR